MKGNGKVQSIDTIFSNFQAIWGCLFFLYARRLRGYTATIMSFLNLELALFNVMACLALWLTRHLVSVQNNFGNLPGLCNSSNIKTLCSVFWCPKFLPLATL